MPFSIYLKREVSSIRWWEGTRTKKQSIEKQACRDVYAECHTALVQVIWEKRLQMFNIIVQLDYLSDAKSGSKFPGGKRIRSWQLDVKSFASCYHWRDCCGAFEMERNWDPSNGTPLVASLWRCQISFLVILAGARASDYSR